MPRHRQQVSGQPSHHCARDPDDAQDQQYRVPGGEGRPVGVQHQRAGDDQQHGDGHTDERAGLDGAHDETLQLIHPRARVKIGDGREHDKDDRRGTQADQRGKLAGRAVQSGVAGAQQRSHDQHIRLL